MRTNPNQEQKKWHNPLDVKESIADYLKEHKVVNEYTTRNDKMPDSEPRVKAYSKIQGLIEQKKSETRKDKESVRSEQNIEKLKAVVDSIFANKNITDHRKLFDLMMSKSLEIDHLKAERTSFIHEINQLKSLLHESDNKMAAMEQRYRHELRELENNQLQGRKLEQNILLNELQHELGVSKQLIADKNATIESFKEDLKSKSEEVKKLEESMKMMDDNFKIKLIEANGLNTQQKELIRLLQRQNHEMENQVLELTRKLNEKDSLKAKFLSQGEETDKEKILSEVVSNSHKRSEKEEGVKNLEEQLNIIQETLRSKIEEFEQKEEKKFKEVENLKDALERKDDELCRYKKESEMLEAAILTIGDKSNEKAVCDLLVKIKESEIHLLEDQAKELKRLLEEDVEELDKADDRIISLISEKEDLENKLGKAEKRLSLYEEDHKNKENEIVKMESRIKLLENNKFNKGSIDVLAEKDKEIEKLKNEFEHTRLELLNEHKEYEQELINEIQELKFQIDDILKQNEMDKEMKTGAENGTNKYDESPDQMPIKINIIKDEHFSPSEKEIAKDPHVASQNDIKNLICMEIDACYEQEDISDYVPSPDLREEVAHLQRELKHKQKQIEQLKEVNQVLNMRINNNEDQYHTARKEREGESILDLFESKEFERSGLKQSQTFELIKQRIIQMETTIKDLASQLKENETIINELRNDNKIYREYSHVLKDLFTDIKKSKFYAALHPDEIEREQESYSPLEILVKIDEYFKYLNEELNSQKDTNREEQAEIIAKNETISNLKHEPQHVALSPDFIRTLNKLGIKPERFQEDLPAKIATMGDMAEFEKGYDHLKTKYDQARSIIKSYKEKDPLNEKNKQLKHELRKMENFKIDNEELHRKIENLTKLLKAKESELNKVLNEKEAILMNKNSHLEDVVHLKKEIEEKEDIIDELQKSNTDLKSKYKDASRVAEENKSIAEKQHSILKSKKKDLKKLKSEVASKDKHIEELESHVSFKQSETVSRYLNAEMGSDHDYMSQGKFNSPQNTKEKRKKTEKNKDMYQSLQPWNLEGQDKTNETDKIPKIEVLYSKYKKSEEVNDSDGQ